MLKPRVKKTKLNIQIFYFSTVNTEYLYLRFNFDARKDYILENKVQ